MRYWISWWQPTEDHRPLTHPPNGLVYTWHCTGFRDDGASSLCAMVEAGSEDAAKEVILRDWPEAKDWRFCEPKTDTDLGDRFPLSPWMKKRINAHKSRMTTKEAAHDEPR